ncbi:MAG: hypothetical protein FWE09_07245 [Treponema sp.]|nr:hypothetical protein [Treponema sp.]
MRIFVLFVCAAFLSACASASPPAGVFGSAAMRAQWEFGNFFANPPDGSIRVLGVASRHHSRRGNEVSQAEIDAAKDDAARKVAMFYGLSGTVEFVQRTGSSVFGFIADLNVDIARAVEDHERFIDGLAFDPERDILVHDRGTIVMFGFRANARQASFIASVGANGRPSWVDRTPAIDGHLVQVGFSQNQIWLRDTVMRSAEAAAARMINGLSTVVENSVVDVEGQGSLTYSTSVGSGALIDFRVIELWIDPADMSVYSLAVAREQ